MTMGDVALVLETLYEQAQEEKKESISEEPTDESDEDVNPAGGGEEEMGEEPSDENTGDPEGDEGDEIGGSESEEGSVDKVGRMYELKRIHYRLINIQTILDSYVDEKLEQIKDNVGRALELFKMVVDNYDKYESRVDDIILIYYDFLNQVYTKVNQLIKPIKN